MDLIGLEIEDDEIDGRLLLRSSLITILIDIYVRYVL